jgi:hypothetical protein
MSAPKEASPNEASSRAGVAEPPALEELGLVPRGATAEASIALLAYRFTAANACSTTSAKSSAVSGGIVP